MHPMQPEAPLARTTMLPEEISWEAWSRMYKDTALWEPVIREICRRAVFPVTQITTGFPGTNAVFLLDDRAVIKIAPPQCHLDHRHELDIGQAIAGRIPIPRILAFGMFRDRIDWPWFLMDYKPGKALRELRGQLCPDNWHSICETMGNFVREIHKTPLQSLSVIDTTPDGWRDFVSARREEAMAAFTEADFLSAAIRGEIVAFFNAFDFPDLPLVLVNADLTEDHLLLAVDHAPPDDGKSFQEMVHRLHGESHEFWRITALIDLADGFTAPPAYEWPALWFCMLGQDRSGLDTFLHAYHPGQKSDEDFRHTLIGFTLLHRFGLNMMSDSLGRMNSPQIGSFTELCNLLFWPSEA